MIRRAVHVVLASLILFPILVLIWKVPLQESHSAWLGKGWEVALLRALTQSAVSAAGSICVGGLLALGLLSLRTSVWSHTYRLLLLLPIFLPQLVIASSVSTFFYSTGINGFGLFGVVFAHVLTNAGLVGVLLEQYTRRELSGSIAIAKVLGASLKSILTRIWLPLVKPKIVTLFLLIFSFCLMSFVSPLLLSPTKPWSLEVLIYDMLRSRLQFQDAIYLSIYQTLIVLLLAWWMQPLRTERTSGSSSYPVRFGFSWLNGLGAMGFLTLVSGLFYFSSRAPRALAEAEGLFWTEWMQAFKGTLQIGAVALASTFVILLCVVFARPNERLHKFLTGFVPLSPVVLAFSLWMLGGNDGSVSIFKIGLGMSILYFPLLYRWRLGNQLQALRPQALVAKSLGASDILVFRRVYWPQCAKTVVDLTSVLAMWAVGDLVMVAILDFRGGGSLAQLVQTLLTSYRPELAALTSLSILALGLCFVLILQLGAKLIFPYAERM